MLEFDTHSWLACLVGESELVVELGLEEFLKLIESVLVSLVNRSDGNSSCSLESDELSKGALSLDDTEWSLSGSAEGWKPAYKLNWINI